MDIHVGTAQCVRALVKRTFETAAAAACVQCISPSETVPTVI